MTMNSMTIYKVIKTLFSVCLFSCLLASCGSALSSLETQQKKNTGNQQKPTCPIDSADNCWVRSLQLIGQCLPPSLVGELTPDRRFCRNSEGLMVYFNNPYDLKPDSKQVDFEVYSRNRKCFRVHKDGNNIAITDSPYGEIRLDSSNTHDGFIQISCLFGESVTIDPKTLTENCSSQKVKTFNDWPDAVFSSEQDNSTRNFMFSFVGLGLGDAPVFHCKESR